MLDLETVEKWIGRVGYVAPEYRCKTATIAVKVLGVTWSYGRFLLTVSPLAGTGSWKVAMDRVEFERRGELL